MVWIHGGALVTGESDDYIPAKLVEDGLTVVTINNRLGALGFLAHPALADANGQSGDYGLMDRHGGHCTLLDLAQVPRIWRARCVVLIPVAAVPTHAS